MHLAQFVRSAAAALLPVVLAPQLASSQIVIQRPDVMKLFTPGSWHYYSGAEGIFDLGRTGGPNIYDFSSIGLTSLETSHNYAVSTVPELVGRYDPAGVTFGDSPTTIEKNPVFYFGTDTAFVLGEASLIPTKRFEHRVPREIMLIYPTVYGSTISQTVTNYDTTFNASGGIVSTNTSSSQEVTTIDGFGVLKLSGRQYECIRVRKEHRGYGDKEFLYMTKEGAFVGVGLIAMNLPDTGLVTTGAQVLLAPGLMSVEQTGGIPHSFGLEQNHPNPFNPSTTITVNLAQRTSVRLVIHNVVGQEIATLMNDTYDAGRYTVTWNGKDDRGFQAATGVYLYRLEAGDFSATKKMVMVK